MRFVARERDATLFSEPFARGLPCAVTRIALRRELDPRPLALRADDLLLEDLLPADLRPVDLRARPLLRAPPAGLPFPDGCRSAACAAATRAIGRRNGEQET